MKIFVSEHNYSNNDTPEPARPLLESRGIQTNTNLQKYAHANSFSTEQFKRTLFKHCFKRTEIYPKKNKITTYLKYIYSAHQKQVTLTVP